MPLRWIFPDAVDADQVRRLIQELRVSPFASELLVRRGFAAPEDAERFLNPRLKSLADPFLLPQMSAAVERILTALDRGERIVLYGDYDVDGVTSLALLTRVLRAFGAEPECFLPSRAEEGYGLSAEGVARCVSEHAPRLLIAVDCGTSSAAEIASLQAQGVDVIVIDHHEGKETLPQCCALVNPKLGDDWQYLCSVGLVFKVAHALLKRRPLAGFDLREYLDLVALGTVADLVPLREENRILVRRGLEQLGKTKWVGLRALIEVSGLSAPFDCGNIGFGLGPRLNAAGRLGTARDALELLLTEDPARARILANSLEVQNRDRRSVEDRVVLEAEEQLAEWFDPARDSAIVVGASGWHPGVVGIVASRLQKRHYRPALVIGFGEDGVGKGSGRSIAGLCLVTALAQCGGFLEKHGGHEMAAGLTIHESRFAEFREAFRACAREHLTAEQLQPQLHLDAEIQLEEIDFALLQQHEALQPFGMTCPQPVFAARGVTPASEPRVLKEKHLSLILRQGGEQHRAMWFGAALEELPRPPWDVAFTIERNEWQGTVSAQIRLKAIRHTFDA
ncbi:MAG TPA: single-stranded-DNA-specific exonuclease RecJ [Chthoniobacteraceae bacterium]|jgi:single-stranded-DNA-specific exonuclease